MKSQLEGATAPEMFMPATIMPLEKARRTPITKMETI
jgi:hypothetical protein